MLALTRSYCKGMKSNTLWHFDNCINYEITPLNSTAIDLKRTHTLYGVLSAEIEYGHIGYTFVLSSF